MKSRLKSLVPGFVLRAYHNRKIAQEARRNANRTSQDVFSEILTGVHTVRSAETLTGWIAAVTLNTVRNRLRSRAVRRYMRCGYRKSSGGLRWCQ